MIENQIDIKNNLTLMSKDLGSAKSKFSLENFPSSKNESWKYSDLAAQLKDFDFNYHGEPNHDLNFDPTHRFGSFDAFIVVEDGIFNPTKSVINNESIEFDFLNSDQLNDSLQLLNADFDSVTAFNTIHLNSGLFLRLKSNIKTNHPVIIYHLHSGKLSHCHSRIHIQAESFSSCKIVEIQENDSNYFLTNIITGNLEDNSFINYTLIQNQGNKSRTVNYHYFNLNANVNIETNTFGLSGKFIRNNLSFRFGKSHSEAHLNGLYIPTNNDHIDNQTFVDHKMPHCNSNETYRGIIADEATGVFNGKILVEIDAQKTNAYQSNKNVLLSANGHVFTKPQLEIFADDVKCSHGATIGQLDNNALFYLRARGIPLISARKLLLNAFASDVLNKCSDEEVKNIVFPFLDSKLNNI